MCSLPIRRVLLLSPSSAPLNLSKELLWEQSSGAQPQGLALAGLGHLVTGVPGFQPGQPCVWLWAGQCPSLGKWEMGTMAIWSLYWSCFELSETRDAKKKRQATALCTDVSSWAE